MIDQIDQFLQTWAQDMLPDVAVMVHGEDADAPGVHIHLLHALPTTPPRHTVTPPLQIALDYIISVMHDQPQTAHQQLGELLFAAMTHEDIVVSDEPIQPQSWSMIGVTPRPAFQVRLHAQRPRERPTPQRVRQPLVVETVPGTAVYGRVLGPDDHPLADVRVIYPKLGQERTTGSDGRFHFALADDAQAHDLRLIVRGHARDVTVDTVTSVDAPFVIRVSSPET